MKDLCNYCLVGGPYVLLGGDEGLPVQGADEDPQNAEGVGKPIDFFFVEPLAPGVAGEDDGDGEKGKDHCMFQGGGDLC